MKFEKINDTDYNIYVFSYEIDNNNILEEIKLIVKKLQKRLKLVGFYKVNAVLKNIGLFLQLILIEKSFCNSVLDLKIDICNDMDIYFKTDDFFKVINLNSVRYYDGNYYVLVDSSFDDILNKVEFGEFVFKDDINNILFNSYIIK